MNPGQQSVFALFGWALVGCASVSEIQRGGFPPPSTSQSQHLGYQRAEQVAPGFLAYREHEARLVAQQWPSFSPGPEVQWGMVGSGPHRRLGFGLPTLNPSQPIGGTWETDSIVRALRERQGPVASAVD